ncbi:transcription factor bHLH35 [Cucumis melo var. makuwa]|uniref:Transcription factor bHLH35 n=1 Tax=Cucumis melo var. makuwa TaxID=1194695 RepID=A0A5A7UC12_CUCMM|nr:transcription factor bHLH35 [Cucumis melo var. makuwa]
MDSIGDHYLNSLGTDIFIEEHLDRWIGSFEEHSISKRSRRRKLNERLFAFPLVVPNLNNMATLTAREIGQLSGVVSRIETKRGEKQKNEGGEREEKLTTIAIAHCRLSLFPCRCLPSLFLIPIRGRIGNLRGALQENGGNLMQRYVNRSQECIGRGYADVEMDVRKNIMRKAFIGELSTSGSDVVNRLLPMSKSMSTYMNHRRGIDRPSEMPHRQNDHLRCIRRELSSCFMLLSSSTTSRRVFSSLTSLTWTSSRLTDVDEELLAVCRDFGLGS